MRAINRRFTVSYEKTLTRTVEITTNGGNVSVNDKAESDQASVEIAPESRSIKLKPQDGYAIESIKADETEITGQLSQEMKVIRI